MNIEDKDLIKQFSAYVKVSIKHTRQEYLERKGRIRNYELPCFEGEELPISEEGDILEKVETMSENMEQGILVIKLLLDQISNSVLFHAVSSLSKLQKEIILLRVVYMKDFKEISSMLGLTPKKAENTYYNAIKKVRKIMKGEQNGI